MSDERTRIEPSPLLAGFDGYSPPKHGAPVELQLAVNEGQAPPAEVLEAVPRAGVEALRRYPDIAPLTAITDPQVGAYDPAARVPMPRLASQARATSFAEVDQGYTEGMAIQEAQRCISCGACCVQACPYDVMQFNHEITKAVKCDLCVEKQGRGEAPACTVVCPTRCIFWGDPETLPAGVEMVL